jgi:hypothetical protein
MPLAMMSAGMMPAVRFTRERIEVTVHPETIAVNGLYTYANPWPIPMSQGLSVPFPVDPSHPAPATVTVTEVDPRSGEDTRSIPAYWVGVEPYFSIRIPARGTMYVRVRYTQWTTAESATYILTTTRPWGKPLEQGEYLLQPRGVDITRSNYPLTGADRLSFVREQFMPDQDWRFTWRSRHTTPS